MLIRLLRTFLGPYRRPITLLVLLQFLQTCATLYLPTLNADIIDDGVVRGDTGFILRHGALMLVVSLAQGVQHRCRVLRRQDRVGGRTGRAGGRVRPRAVVLRP